MIASITEALLKGLFLVFLIIGCKAVTVFERSNECLITEESIVDQLRHEERFFDSIRSFKYYMNDDILSSVSCFDDLEKGLRNCTTATVKWTFASVEPKYRNWTIMGTVGLNFSNYDYKETEIVSGLLYPDTILITLLKSKKNNKVFVDLISLSESRKLST